jgi:peroxidase
LGRYIQSNNGLLQSDQELFLTSGADTVDIVNYFNAYHYAFVASFVEAVIKIGNISVLTAT